MDEKHSDYSLKAPGSSGAPRHLPGRGSFPRVDDHLVQPEVTRDEIIEGRRVVAFPAESPHATQHGDLHYVLRAHVASGYLGAVDLLTRQGKKSDFASDACVYREGVDQSTGARYLEEIAFEVVSEQSDREVTEKAAAMHRRGVRRIFAAFVKGPRLCEWSPESQSWRSLAAGSRIEDRCLAVALPVAALLDAALADNAVAEALIAKGNPMILNLEAAAKATGWAEGNAAGQVEGKAEGRARIAKSILKILEARGVAVDAAQREEILRCSDFDRLDQWLLEAALASSADELTSES
ncbi:MAG: Uma2 family endonuclease [Acidobacteria bacterium]|nr:Uma2 family endonuclease [Acidobacteriota bacterium]